MAIRYFRHADPTKKGFRVERYMAVNDTPSPDEFEEDSHPYAHMHLSITPEKYIPTFSNTGTDHNGHWLNSISQELGVHPDYVEHVYEESLHKDYKTQKLINNSANRMNNDGTWTNPSNNPMFKVNAARLKRRPEFKQPEQLFVETPKKVVVTDLFADPSMKSPAMTLGAMALSTHNVPKLTADESLSDQSAALSRHAHDLGVVTGSKDDFVSFNGIEEDSLRLMPDELSELQNGKFYDFSYSPVSKEDVGQARDTMRQILRNNRGSAEKPHLSTQFEHPRLPGLENF